MNHEEIINILEGLKKTYLDYVEEFEAGSAIHYESKIKAEAIETAITMIGKALPPITGNMDVMLDDDFVG